MGDQTAAARIMDVLMLWICFSTYLITIQKGFTGAQMTEWVFSEYEKDCPEIGQRSLELPYKVPWGHPMRSYVSLPNELEIQPSYLPNAGLGVISKTFIPKYTWLGEYEGEHLTGIYKKKRSWYSWMVKRGGEQFMYVDGYHPHVSTYMRFINSPNNHRDENVDILECYGRVFFIIKKDIHPGQELLVYYGSNYMEHLGVDADQYYETQNEDQS